MTRPELSVLVPYRAGELHRDHAWRYNRSAWLAYCHTDSAELIVESPGPGASPAEFNHPAAINAAFARARGDVLCIADADTAFDPLWIAEATNLITEGEPWVLPQQYRKLTRKATEMVLLEGADPAAAKTDWVGEAVSWSGLVMVPREGFEAVRGYDERISWWGADDCAFALTMNALWGDCARLPGAAFHLWHPAPLDQTYGHQEHRRQQALVDRYIAAAGDPDAISRVRASEWERLL